MKKCISCGFKLVPFRAERLSCTQAAYHLNRSLLVLWIEFQNQQWWSIVFFSSCYWILCWGFHWRTRLSWGDSLSRGSVLVTANCWSVLRLSPRTNLALVRCFWLRLNNNLKFGWEVRSATRKCCFLSGFSWLPFVPSTAWWAFLGLNVSAAVKDCITFKSRP